MLITVPAALIPFNPVLRYTLERIFCSVGLKIFGIKLEVRGSENLQKHRPCVFISNHQHGLDLFISASMAPMKTVFLAKTSLLLIPFFGLPFWLLGNILINRTNREKALKSMEKINRAVALKKESVWIMPEGTRSHGKDILLPFKKGAFVTAAVTDVPIIGVCISSYLKHINWNRWRSCTVIVDVLDPIAVKEETVEQTRDFTYQVMRDRIEEITREVTSWERDNRSLSL